MIEVLKIKNKINKACPEAKIQVTVFAQQKAPNTMMKLTGIDFVPVAMGAVDFGMPDANSLWCCQVKAWNTLSVTL